jgi:3',5'-cyclic AMP phosphodiesterase CpdA
MFMLLALSLILNGCKATTSAEPENILSKYDEVKIILGTDLHYLSPSLTDQGEGFLNMVRNGDGKLVQYSSQITDAFLSEVDEAKPDVLILSGDLTFNGEKQSHLDLQEKLSNLKSTGTNILVIPGNHDINYHFSYSYKGNTAYKTENVSQEEFREIYGEFGYNNAISKDGSSFSYLYPLSEDLYILMIDTNTEDAPESVKASTFVWAREELRKTSENGITVIGVTHQNLLKHNSLFTDGFVINNNEKLLSLFEEYTIPLNLSGHMHIQHISKSKKGVQEVATSSLAVAPHNYGVISVDKENTISYKTKKVDVTSWAKNKDINDSNFSDFETYSRNFFDSNSYRKVRKELSKYNLTEEELEAMCSFTVKINRGYFDGTLFENIDSLRNDNAYNLWLTKGTSSFFSTYLKSILEDNLKNETELIIKN